MIPARIRSIVFPAAILLIGLAGGALIFYSTHWGPWAMSDSAAYLSTARNLISGVGFGYNNPNGSFLPFTYYPPLYPLVLAIPGLLGANLVNGARLIDMFLFPVLVIGLGWGTYRFTRLPWLGLGLSGLILISPVLLDAYSSLMSETLFITTGFISLIALLFYLRENKRLLLCIAALFCGLAMLTRYIGFAFLLTALIALLLLSGQRIIKRLADIFIFTILCILPTLASQLWVYRVSAHVAGRSFGLNAPFLTLASKFANQFAGVLSSWLPWSTHGLSLFPPLARILVITILTLLASGFVWLRLRDRPEYGGLLRFNGLMLIFCTVYPISLGVSYIFSSPPVAIDNRMLSPLLPALLAGFCGLLAGLIISMHLKGWGPLACVVIAFAICSRDIPNAWRAVETYHEVGLGYTAKVWHAPHAFDPLKQIPPGVNVISNTPAMFLFYENRFPYDLANGMYWAPGSTEPTFGTGPGQIQGMFKAGAALVIFLPDWQSIFGSQSQARLAQLTTGLYLAYSSPEFNIYYYSAQSQAPSCNCGATQEPSP